MTGNRPEGTVGERIRALLAERHLSQRQLAVALAGDGAATNGIESMRRQISSWVNDQHAPSPANAEALADYLGVPAEWLLDTTPRRNLAASLEELADALERLSEWMVEQTARAEAQRQELLDALDLRLQHNEALIGQLLEGQLTSAAALEEIVKRLDAAASTPRGQHRSGDQ